MKSPRPAPLNATLCPLSPLPLPQSRCDGTSQINEIAQAYDFQSSAPQQGLFSALMWYNATGMYGREGGAPPYILRVNQVRAAAGAPGRCGCVAG